MWTGRCHHPEVVWDRHRLAHVDTTRLMFLSLKLPLQGGKPSGMSPTMYFGFLLGSHNWKLQPPSSLHVAPIKIPIVQTMSGAHCEQNTALEVAGAVKEGSAKARHENTKRQQRQALKAGSVKESKDKGRA